MGSIDLRMNRDRQTIPTKRVTEILQPYFILSYIMGIRAIDSNSRVKPKLGLIFPLLINGYNVVLWFAYPDRVDNYNHRHVFDILKYIYFVGVCLKILNVAASIVIGFLQSKLWKWSKNSLDKVDKTLEVLGSKARFRTIYIRTLTEIAFFFVYLLAILTSITYTILVRTNSGSIKLFGLGMFILMYAYGEVVEYTVTMEFLTFVRCIKSEMERINDLLNDVNVLPLSSIAMELINNKEMNKNCFTQIFTTVPSSDRTYSRLLIMKNEIFRIRRLLRTIRQIHLELHKVSNTVSCLYGIQMSLAMAMNIFYSTCCFYILYSWRYHFNNGNILINEIFSMIFFCLFTSAKIVLVNFTCDKAMQHARKTSEIVYTFYAENTDYEIRQEIKMFSMQMSHCHSTYSAFGLYSFNCQYICSWLRVLTTYLVIMIQMT